MLVIVLLMSLIMSGILNEGSVPYSTSVRYVNMSEGNAILLLHAYDKTTLNRRVKDIRKKLNQHGTKIVIGELNVRTNRYVWQLLRQPTVPCLARIYYGEKNQRVVLSNNRYKPVSLNISAKELTEWCNTGKSKHYVRFGLCPQEAGLFRGVPARPIIPYKVRQNVSRRGG